jgi:hypothetical protein
MSERNFDEFLQPGESAVDPGVPEHGKNEWAYGYRTIPIEDSTHTAGNSVLLEVQPGGAVEPAMIDGGVNMNLSVKALKGSGYVVAAAFFSGEGPRLALINEETGPVKLKPGDAYYYINPGDTELILRDDATPAFEGHEEAALNDPDSVVRDLGVKARQIDLPESFWAAFGLLKSTKPEELNDREKIITNAVYVGNHGIGYRVDKIIDSADHYEETGELTPSVHYTQLNDGNYPAGTEYTRSVKDFLHGVEEVDGVMKYKFHLRSVPVTAEVMELLLNRSA